MRTKKDKSILEILIVDDNTHNLKILDEILKDEGYKVRIATNGEQALSSIEADEPDLLLLDVHMPGVDGFEVCKRINAPDSPHKSLPIIFISALTDTFNKLKGFEAGAVDYITKPFDIDEVKIRIKTHLKLKDLLQENEALKMELAARDEEIRRLKQQ